MLQLQQVVLTMSACLNVPANITALTSSETGVHIEVVAIGVDTFLFFLKKINEYFFKCPPQLY